jgi:hypothetical protein
MSDEQRIENLQKLISEQNSTLKAGLQKRMWVTVGLVVFVLCYMTFITISIGRTMKPENVADMVLGTMVMKAPEIRTGVIKTAEDSIPGLIDSGFEQAYAILPQLREILKDQVESAFPPLPPEFYEQIAREVDIHFSSHQEIMESLLEKMDNEQKRKEFLQTLSDGLKGDIDSFMTEAMDQTDMLKAKLDYLVTTPDRKLTEEQLQTKKILIYFLYLAKDYNEGI